MAKEKIWIDCPVCGAKGTMKYKSNFSDKIKIIDYGLIVISNLSGYFCSECKEGFYSIASKNYFNEKVAEAKARRDSKKIKASEILSSELIAKTLGITKQSVNKWISEGKIPYVFVAGERKPYIKDLSENKISKQIKDFYKITNLKNLKGLKKTI